MNLEPGEEDLKYISSLFGSMANETDRGIVILLTAELDMLLGKILEKALLPKSGCTEDILGSGYSLGNFSARIELVYRLGFISEITAHDLHIIRKIRNCFAHGSHKVNLDSEEPKKLIEKAQLINEKNILIT